MVQRYGECDKKQINVTFLTFLNAKMLHILNKCHTFAVENKRKRIKTIKPHNYGIWKITLRDEAIR